MKTTEAVEGHWPLVLSHYGLPGETGNRHIKCPLCDKKKFRISRWKNTLGWICTCGSGNLWALISEFTGKEFKVLAAEIDQLIGNRFESEERPENKTAKRSASAIDRFKALSFLKGSNGEKYLRSRGIYELPEKGVRYSANSGLVAVVTDENVEPSYMHITHLNGAEKTNRRLHAIKNKANLEFTKSLAIRMFSTQSTLGIAEGIETALSAKSIYKLPVWSVINTSFMKRFIAPAGVDHLMIFADSDSNGAGHASAFECANKNILRGPSIERVTVVWPERGDFNDVLIDGLECYKWEFAK